MSSTGLAADASAKQPQRHPQPQRIAGNAIKFPTKRNNNNKSCNKGVNIANFPNSTGKGASMCSLNPIREETSPQGELCFLMIIIKLGGGGTTWGKNKTNFSFLETDAKYFNAISINVVGETVGELVNIYFVVLKSTRSAVKNCDVLKLYRIYLKEGKMLLAYFEDFRILINRFLSNQLEGKFAIPSSYS